MIEAYTYVEGDHLVDLIRGVLDEFHARPTLAGDGSGHPNTVQVVALDQYMSRPVDARIAVLRELVEGNADLILTRPPQDVFAHSDAAGTYLTDLVCEVVRDVLWRNPAVRAEDQRRALIAALADGDV